MGTSIFDIEDAEELTPVILNGWPGWAASKSAAFVWTETLNAMQVSTIKKKNLTNVSPHETATYKSL